MFILVETSDGSFVVVKRSDIRRVYKKNDTETFICFTTKVNTPLTVKGSPEDFFRVYLDVKN